MRCGMTREPQESIFAHIRKAACIRVNSERLVRSSGGAQMADLDNGDAKLERIYWALRLSLGGTAFLAGADKFFDKMTDWEKYLSPVAERNLPISGRNFMRLVGVIEMGVGAMILSRKPRWGALIASGWLTAIAANLVTEQDWWDIAARDVNMAVGALALAGLHEVRAARPRIAEKRKTLTGVATRVK